MSYALAPTSSYTNALDNRSPLYMCSNHSIHLKSSPTAKTKPKQNAVATSSCWCHSVMRIESTWKHFRVYVRGGLPLDYIWISK